jgi:uncharacterized membrane protein
MESIVLGLHVLFAAILVGGQLLLFFAVVPSTWLIDDHGLRRRVTAVVAQRFGMMAGVSLAGLVVTGLFQFYSDDLVPPDVRENMMDYRFGPVFVTKMTLLVVLVVMIGIHGAYFGRRIGQLSDAVEAGEADPGELERLRRNSLLFATLMVLVSIALIFLGATLGNDAYSHIEL